MNAARYHHGDLREALIDAAEELIAESGAGWSLREAARSLGVSSAAPYRHFADKEALSDAAVVRGYLKLEHRYELDLAKVVHDADRVATVALAFYSFAVENPELFALMFESPRLQASAEALHSYQVFEAEVDKAQQRAELPAGSARDLTHAVWSVAHGIAELVNNKIFGRRHGRSLTQRTIVATLAGLSTAAPGTW